ncbi:MAG: molybdopterin molybdotransferase MoeA [Rhizobiaceae bacterium]|nr:molybdopterin molybdotransferase MoeA [Rhizobiaceae bacterium]MCV0405709.1 molybdopterin molybdotransferase MoeA [Rhizobiaceae bacterium]
MVARPSPSSESCSAGQAAEVIPVDIAAAKAVAIARPVRETERLPLLGAAGRVLATDIGSQMDLPPFDSSAMDGYAVRLAAFAGKGPWRFRVTGRMRAGDPDTCAWEGDAAAVRIFTGAPVPGGFDAVLMQERCERSGDGILIAERPRAWENIRRAGEYVRIGDRLLAEGEALAPQKLALLAGSGVADVEVLRKVRVGLLSTGSELRDPGQSLASGQIYNSNRVLLRAMLAGFAWAEVLDFGIVPDHRDALAEAIGASSGRCDVLVTTGGVSAGDEDHVVAAARSNGASLEVLKVAMRPGKPLKVGVVGGTLFAGLPGNPNATLVTFRQIALPAIRATAGLRDVHPAWFPAAAGFSYAKKRGRTEFVPVRVAGRDGSGAPVLEMLGRGSSANLGAMAQAEGIALLPPEADMIEEGMPLRFEPFCHC